jgi:Ca2+-binding RTX toxin-like protein
VNAGSGNDDVRSPGPLPAGLTGGDGNDVLAGSDGDDLLQGGTGHDSIDGSNGSDVLSGGDGNDVQTVERGHSRLGPRRTESLLRVRLGAPAGSR